MNRLTRNGQAIIASFIDSWQAIALAGRRLGFLPIKPQRSFIYDLFALAVSLGGLVMALVSKATGSPADGDMDFPNDTPSGISFHKATTISVGVGMLGAVM